MSCKLIIIMFLLQSGYRSMQAPRLAAVEERLYFLATSFALADYLSLGHPDFYLSSQLFPSSGSYNPSVLSAFHCLLTSVHRNFWTSHMLDTGQVELMALVPGYLSASSPPMLCYYSHFMLNEVQFRSYCKNNVQASSRTICLNKYLGFGPKSGIPI